jgi:hypothetical protein
LTTRRRTSSGCKGRGIFRLVWPNWKGARGEDEKHLQTDLEELEKQRRRLLDEGARGTPKK